MEISYFHLFMELGKKNVTFDIYRHSQHLSNPCGREWMEEVSQGAQKEITEYVLVSWKTARN